MSEFMQGTVWGSILTGIILGVTIIRQQRRMHVLEKRLLARL